MPARRASVSGLSDEQADALRAVLKALREEAGLTYAALSEKTGVSRNDISNFRRRLSRHPPWLDEFSRAIAAIASEQARALREAIPDIDDLIRTLTAGEAASRAHADRMRLLRDAARTFLEVTDESGRALAQRYANTYLCYRYSSRPQHMVCTAIKINPQDPAANVTTFANVYRSLEGHSLWTGGIVLRQAHERLFLVGLTAHGAGISTMALNEPPGRTRLFPYMNGLAMTVNASGTVLASRVLCIPTHEQRSARNLETDPRVGVRPTTDVLPEIRGLLDRLPEHARDIVIAGLLNAVGTEELLTLQHAG